MMEKTKKVLFLDTLNGHRIDNPQATLVEVPLKYSKKMLEDLEIRQIGVNRIGGSWERIMRDGKISHTVLNKGYEIQYDESDYDFKYNLIPGNY